jgi:hypothetical protein
VTVNASIKDNLGVTVSNSYAITVNAAGSQVSGQISTNSCGNNGNMPAITVSINTSPVQTATTDSNGNYSFASIPNGTYTITPSITGPSSVFYPATLTGVVVNNSTVTGENFQVALGYTVSGTVSYTGTKTGQVYVALNGNNCGSNSLGTSITAPGAFTVHGVGPGTYTLSAWMDTLNNGSLNVANPSGTAGSNVTVSSSNITGAAVTLTDPTVVAPVASPTLQSVSPTDQGVVIPIGPPTTTTNGNVESATSYTVQWSADQTFATGVVSHTMAAEGANGTNVWILNNSVVSGGFSNSQVLYFRARGETTAGHGPWSSIAGPVTIGAPSAGNTISGTVTFSGTATGPLYVGFFDQSTAKAYATGISNPVSPQAYTVMVPNGTNYFFFGIIDQDKNGLVNAGDISNTSSGGSSSQVTISGNATQNLTLSSANSKATVTTQHWQDISTGGTSIGYNLNFDVRAGIKLPVSAQLISGPNVIDPIDLGNCTDCGSAQFQYYAGIASNIPVAGDSYSFRVTYSDATSETVTGTVSAVLNAFATSLAPTTGTSTNTTPTFTWTYPSSPSSYLYYFWISDNNGNQVWQIPGNNSKLNGFPSTVTQIVWGTDPTGNSSNTPSPSSLNTSTTYTWGIQAGDSNGNSAQTQVSYKP